MEGNKKIGTFTRKDNGKELKALREIVGDEMVQVGSLIIMGIFTTNMSRHLTSPHVTLHYLLRYLIYFSLGAEDIFLTLDPNERKNK